MNNVYSLLIHKAKSNNSKFKTIEWSKMNFNKNILGFIKNIVFIFASKYFLNFIIK